MRMSKQERFAMDQVLYNIEAALKPKAKTVTMNRRKNRLTITSKIEKAKFIVLVYRVLA